MKEKKINIFMDGRTGNQLFQMAFLKYLERHGYGKGNIVNYGPWGNCIQGLCVDTEYQFVSESNTKVGGLRLKLFYRYLESRFPFRAIKGAQKRDHAYKRLLAKLGFVIDRTSASPLIPSRLFSNLYIYGFFENPIYAMEVRDWAIRAFSAQRLSQKAEQLAGIIKNCCCPVCVSVRRGDYFSEAYVGSRGICRVSYFRRAMEKLSQMVTSKITYFIFSDDPAWCRQNLDIPGKAIFEEENALSIADKLTCMSICRHFIISNSTFSWWAQFLGTANDKIVIAPHKWSANGDSNYVQKLSNWTLVSCLD